jgi:hypothetical protein
MIRNISRLLIVLGVVVLGGVWFSTAWTYSGDGHFVDNGPFAANDRYLVELGTIDLTAKSERTYRLENLPEVNFVVGIQLFPKDHSMSMDKTVVNPTIYLKLYKEDGTSIFGILDPLERLTWSTPLPATNAFVYQRELPSSFFTADRHNIYFLTVSVIEPDQAASSVDAKVLLKSGGWK